MLCIDEFSCEVHSYTTLRLASFFDDLLYFTFRGIDAKIFIGFIPEFRWNTSNILSNIMIEFFSIEVSDKKEGEITRVRKICLYRSLELHSVQHFQFLLQLEFFHGYCFELVILTVDLGSMHLDQ